MKPHGAKCKRAGQLRPRRRQVRQHRVEPKAKRRLIQMSNPIHAHAVAGDLARAPRVRQQHTGVADCGGLGREPRQWFRTRTGRRRPIQPDRGIGDDRPVGQLDQAGTEAKLERGVAQP